MKITILGGTGLVGASVAVALRSRGIETCVVSRSTGVDVLTGVGLPDALAGAEVVLDLTDPRSRGDLDVNLLDFHATAARRLGEAARTAGVGHVVVLSAVGADRLVLSDFFLAKITQESLVRTCGIPFTIIRTATLFEQIYRIVDAETDEDGAIRVPPLEMRPAAAVDVGEIVAEAAIGTPRNDVFEVGGPETLDLATLIQGMLTANVDPRGVVVEDDALFYGMQIGRERLLPRQSAVTAGTRFEDWLRAFVARA